MLAKKQHQTATGPECLALIADTARSGARVAREPDTLFEARAKPVSIVSDNGTGFTPNAILTFAGDRKIDWHDIAPAKPTQNAFIESFSARLRDELLNETLFIHASRQGHAGGLAQRL